MIPLNPAAESLLDIDPSVGRPAALPDRIYAVLKHRILTCAVRPGEKIVEATLCQEMQVSRTPPARGVQPAFT